MARPCCRRKANSTQQHFLLVPKKRTTPLSNDAPNPIEFFRALVAGVFCFVAQFQIAVSPHACLVFVTVNGPSSGLAAVMLAADVRRRSLSGMSAVTPSRARPSSAHSGNPNTSSGKKKTSNKAAKPRPEWNVRCVGWCYSARVREHFSCLLLKEVSFEHQCVHDLRVHMCLSQTVDLISFSIVWIYALVAMRNRALLFSPPPHARSHAGHAARPEPV